MRWFSCGIRWLQSSDSFQPKNKWSQPAGTFAMICSGRMRTIAIATMPIAAVTFSTNWIRSFITTLYIPPTTQ
jgi:hypothetical protein